MDFRIRSDPKELESTDYVEIGPGKYAGKHWQPGFIFVWEDAFGMAEGIIAREFPAYDHFAMNDIPASVARSIVAEWREISTKLAEMTRSEAREALNITATFSSRLDAEVETSAPEIAEMLGRLADSVEAFCDKGDWVCVLGM